MIRGTALLLLTCVAAGCAPDAEVESCNGIDDDGDGVVDEGSDEDLDGAWRCAVDPARADCNDLDPRSHPGAPEACDGADNDCDGVLPPHEQDLDGDGRMACAGDCDDLSDALNDWDVDRDGWASCDGDCDDARPDVHPYALGDCDDGDDDPANDCEACNGLDDDCDGVVPLDEVDADGDGQPACGGDCDDADPEREGLDRDGDGQSVCGEDCDDTNPAMRSGEPEICDGLDNDCDGTADEGGAEGEAVWYADEDADGFGDASAYTFACERPDAYVADDTDCDDEDPTAHPAGVERCDAIDQDCDGEVDEGLALTTYYADADGDSFGDAGVALAACALPDGHVADASDCDDATGAVYPGATEVCGGADEDCDGTVDEADAADALAWFADADGDGFGDPALPTWACSPPAAHVADATDCDAADAAVYPGAPEACNDGADSDCDGADDPADPDAPCGAIAAASADLVVLGEDAADAAGTVIAASASLGDLDGDGLGELVVGAPDARSGAASGAVWVVSGAALVAAAGAGAPISLADAWRLPGAAAGDEAGTSLALPGDLDGDGAFDLAVGAPYADDAGLDAGVVYLLSHDTSVVNLDDAAFARIDGAAARAGAGASLAAVRGRGMDLVVGASCCHGAAVSSGAYLFLDAGSRGDLTLDDADLRWEGAAADELGAALAAGDVDGDGLDDVLVGAPGRGLAGEVWLLVGAATALVLEGVTPGDRLGETVLVAHLDADGYADLVVAAPSVGAGAAWLVLGGASPFGTLAPAAASFAGEAASDRLGASLAAADADGDGQDDLLIGAPGSDRGSAGAGAVSLQYAPFGGAVYLSDPDVCFVGAAEGDALGVGLGTLGDLWGDPLPELALGAAGGDDGGADAGHIYLFGGDP